MKLFILMLLVLSLSLSSVSAGLEILSSSPVQFFNSDSQIGNEAYLITAVENGGSERLYFSNFPVASGYSLKNTNGYITGTARDIFASYPYNRKTFPYEIYHVVKLNGGNTKWFLNADYAQGWCDDLAIQRGISSAYAFAGKPGDLYMGNYYCYVPESVGIVADVGGYQYRWTEDFNIYNSITNENFVMTLSSTDTEGSWKYAPNREVVIRYSFSGLNINSYIPDLSSRYSVFQSGGTNRIVERLDSTEIQPYQSQYQVMDTFLRSYLGSNTYQTLIVNQQTCFFCSSANDPEFVRQNIDSQINTLTATKTISESGWSTTLEALSSTSGRINLKKINNDPPISPVFSIKLDAEWVGIYQPRGDPQIISFEAAGTKQFIEGDVTARFISRVKNNGEASTFSYILTCTPSNFVSIDSISNQNFASGETKVLEHRVQANTAGENINAQCSLIVRDRNDPSIQTQAVSGSITFIEANQCPAGLNAGSQTCDTDGSILVCRTNNAGILVLQESGITCPNGCSLIGGQAVCNEPPQCQSLYQPGRTSTDGLCESFEEIGEVCQSINDCGRCGDGYCSNKESSEICPLDCGVPPGQTGPSGGNVNWLIIGIIGGSLLLVGGAIYLRLRLLGYFK